MRPRDGTVGNAFRELKLVSLSQAVSMPEASTTRNSSASSDSVISNNRCKGQHGFPTHSRDNIVPRAYYSIGYPCFGFRIDQRHHSSKIMYALTFQRLSLWIFICFYSGLCYAMPRKHRSEISQPIDIRRSSLQHDIPISERGVAVVGKMVNRRWKAWFAKACMNSP